VKPTARIRLAVQKALLAKVWTLIKKWVLRFIEALGRVD